MPERGKPRLSVRERQREAEKRHRWAREEKRRLEAERQTPRSQPVPWQEPSQPVQSHLHEGSGCESNPTPPSISPVEKKPLILFKRENRPTRTSRTPRAPREPHTTSEDEQPPALEDSPLYDSPFAYFG